MHILIPFALTAIMMGAFLVTERRLRKDASSTTLETTEYDKGTTRLVGTAFGASWLVLFLSLLANYFRIGSLEPSILFNTVGVFLMLFGFTLRTVAARTLGRFYSRTLRVKDDHRVVSEGMYQWIRHPGYLGMIVMFLGAGVTVANFIVISVVAVLIVPAYLKRISVEESMLSNTLGPEYVEYMKRTKRLIPFLY